MSRKPIVVAITLPTGLSTHVTVKSLRVARNEVALILEDFMSKDEARRMTADILAGDSLNVNGFTFAFADVFTLSRRT